MLRIEIPLQKLFDEEHKRLVTVPAVTLEFEHSLVSLSKWESEFKQAFLNEKRQKTSEMTRRYLELMLLTPVEDFTVLSRLTPSHAKQIGEYINDRQSATYLPKMPGSSSSREIVTSELIYYWMTILQIPWSAETWNLNRLLTLIDLTNRKNNPQKNTNNAESAKERYRINEERKKKYNTSG